MFKLLLGIADQIQKAAAVPQDGARVPAVHPGQSAGDAADQRVPLLVFFRQLVLGAVHIVGQLQARPATLPVDDPVLDQKGPLQDRILKFPLVEVVLGQFAVGAEGAGGRSPLDDLVAFPPHQLDRGGPQDLTGILVQIQQLIGVHVADVDVALIGIQHPVKITQLLPVEPGLLLFFRGQRVHIRKLRPQHRSARRRVLHKGPIEADPGESALLAGQAEGRLDLAAAGFGGL